MMAGSFTIITDLGGVLLAVDKGPMCARLADYSSLPLEEIRRHFSNRVLTKIDLGFGKGLLTPRQFYGQMGRKLKLKGLSFEAFVRIYSGIFKRKPDTLNLMRKLSKKHTLAILSNTDALHCRKWSKLLGKDLNLFKQVILSFRVHAAKPGKEIFLEALKKLEVRPRQCIYIDDRAEYARAAAKVGMKGILFTSVAQLRKDLKKLGVNQ